jgi:hypothetical protein
VRAGPVAAPQPLKGRSRIPDLNAEGVIALAIVFAIEGGGRIVARTGQKEFERFVKSVRKNKPDFEAGWAGDPPGTAGKSADKSRCPPSSGTSPTAAPPDR